MKRLSMHSASCSCTTCVYRSRSKLPSVQQLLEDGTRIDKLYYGKYLPLRERKLLEKLIRTREIYDDVRTELLSSSGSSDQTKPSHKHKKRGDDNSEKNSAVLKIVDLVDRGQFGSTNTSKLSSCCSCCSCKSLRKIKKRMEKHPLRVRPPHIPYEEIARYTIEAEKRGRMHRRKLSTKLSNKMRAVRFKMSKMKADSCECTLSLSSVTKRPSKAFTKKVRSIQMDEQRVQREVKIPRKTLKKKICGCSCKIASKIKNIRTSTVKYTEPVMRNLRPSKIKKDSLTLFKEKLLKKQVLKYGECLPGTCVEDECIPEECLEKKRRRKRHKRSIGTRSKKVKLSDSRTQTGLSEPVEQVSTPDFSTNVSKTETFKSFNLEKDQRDLGHVICECKPLNKSVSSTTDVIKDQSFVKHKSKVIRTKSRVTRKKVALQEEVYEEIPPEPPKPAKSPTSLKRTKAPEIPPQEEDLSETDVICECKPFTKSVSSTTDVKKEQSFAKPKSKVIKTKSGATRKKVALQEEVYEEIPPEPPKPAKSPTSLKKTKAPEISPREEDLSERDVICECKPFTKSVSSTIDVKKEQSFAKHKSKVIKTKSGVTRKQIVLPEEVYEEIPSEPPKLAKSPTSIKKTKKPERISQEEDFSKTDVICECKPFTKSVSSTTNIKKDQSFAKRKSKVNKTKSGATRKQMVSAEEVYEEMPPESPKLAKSPTSLKKTKKPDITPQEGDLPETDVICECKPFTKTTSSTLTTPFPKSKRMNKRGDIQKHKSKKIRDSVLPFPRECEPFMCIPYECDPENCARILLSRSKSPGRSAMSATDRLRRKSVGSTTLSRKSSSRSRRIQSKSTESFTMKPKHISKERFPQKVEKDINSETTHPQRQAVRISSSFSFNIEFYKDLSPSVKSPAAQNLTPIPQKNRKVQKKGYETRGHKTRHTLSQNTSSQSRSSQSYKNIQIGHTLKRCFCTLKLLQKKRQKVQHAVSKRTMAAIPVEELDNVSRKTKTQTKPLGIAYIIPPTSKLLPYECEPNFCTPGECNPYECAERIKERNRKEARRISKETNTASAAKISLASQSLVKSSSRRIQAIEHRKKKHKAKHSNTSKTESKISANKPERQAVRIGSSFSFNIEFSKVQNNQQSAQGMKSEYKSEKPITRKSRSRMSQKGIIVHKPYINHAASGLTENVKTKQTNTKPFLERCFCTMKLLNKNKKKVETVTPLRNHNKHAMYLQNKSITAHRANIQYNDILHKKYLPHECFCVPDEYDPSNSKNLIKLRNINLKHQHSNTDNIKTRSTFSETTRTITYSKSGNTQSHTKRSREKANKLKESDIDSMMCNQSDRRVVRIESSFSFNVEFYKENPSPEMVGSYVKSTKKNPKTISADQGSGNAEMKRKERRIDVGSIVKRCLCTLKFKKGQNTGLLDSNNDISKKSKFSYPQICDCSTSMKTSYQLRSTQIQKVKSTSTKSSYRLPNSQICGCKSTSTKTSYKLPKQKISRSKSTSTKSSYRMQKSKINKPVSSFRSHEYTPNLFGSGSRDPLERYEHMKRQRMKQSKKDHAVNILNDVRPTSSIYASRQSVQLGSDFNFNIEFSRSNIVSSGTHKGNKSRIDYNLTSDIQTVRKIKAQGSRDKRSLKQQQDNKIRKEVKVSNVGFSLKRCFCTHGLQKKKGPSKIPNQSELYRYQPINAHFVQVIHGHENKKHLKSPCNIQLKRSACNKSVRKKLKLTDSNRLLKKIKLNQNSMEKIRYNGSNLLENSGSITRREHFQSQVGLNVNEYNVGYLDTIRKTNPFYQSFYALNVRVSKLKNTKPRKNNQCECLESGQVLNQLSETDSCQTKSTGSKIGAYFCKKPRPKQPPLHLGSDLSITMGVYRDTNTNPLRQAINVGSDVKFNLGFYKGSGDKLKDTGSQVGVEKDQAVRISNLIRCLCTPMGKKPGTQKVSSITSSKKGTKAKKNNDDNKEETVKKMQKKVKEKKKTQKEETPKGKKPGTQKVSSITSSKKGTKAKKNDDDNKEGTVKKMQIKVKEEKKTQKEETPKGKKPGTQKVSSITSSKKGTKAKKNDDDNKEGTVKKMQIKVKEEKKTQKEETPKGKKPGTQKVSSITSSKKGTKAKKNNDDNKEGTVKKMQIKVKEEKKTQKEETPKGKKPGTQKVSSITSSKKDSTAKKNDDDNKEGIVKKMLKKVKEEKKTQKEEQKREQIEKNNKKKVEDKIIKKESKQEKIENEKKKKEEKKKGKKQKGTMASDPGKGFMNVIQNVSRSKRQVKSKASLTKGKGKNVVRKPTVPKKKGDTSFRTPYKQKQYQKYKRPLDTNSVSFGSKIGFNMEFFRDSSGGDNRKYSGPSPEVISGLLKCGCVSKPPGLIARKCACFFNPSSATARNPSSATARNPSSATARNLSSTTARDPSSATAKNPSSATAKNPSSATAGNFRDICGPCKNNKKKVKKDAKSVKFECNAETCGPGDCDPDSNKQVKKRSKNTKVKETGPPLVKSAEMDRHTLKNKRETKSLNECNPRDCQKKMKHLSLSAAKAAKAANMQNTCIPNVQNNTSSQKTSILHKCMCIIKPKKIKQPKCMCDAGTNTKKKKDFNKIIEKCFCNLKKPNEGSELTPKPSCAKIPQTRDRQERIYRPPTPTLKLEVKAKGEQNMETIMPYCKRKFSKKTSRIKLEITANENWKSLISKSPEEFGATKKKVCTCSRDKNAIKMKDPIHGEQDLVMYCPICQNITMGNEVTCDGQKSKQKKKNKKGQHICACPICPICKTAKTDEKSNPCPCCQPGAIILSREFLLNSAKNIYSNVFNKVCHSVHDIVSKHLPSGIAGKILGDPNLPTHKRPPKERTKPFFEMVVNENNMNIVNKEEILRKLGSTGKYTSTLKKAQKAAIRGQIPPPVMEMKIDRRTANIVNSTDVLRQMTSKERGKSQMKSKSYAAAETFKQAPIKLTKSERNSKKHKKDCKCCDCTNRKRKLKGGVKLPMKHSQGPTRKLKKCTCGSVICKKDWDKLKREERSVKSLKIRPCVCGSNVCRDESQKMPEMLLELARQAERDKDKAKQDIINEKLYQKARLKRKKQYAAEDKIRWKKRAKEDKRQMKLLKKYDTGVSALIVAESLLDLSKFGIKALIDTLRSIGRVAKHPRDGVYHVKDSLKYPGYAAKELRESCKGMGLYSTMGRIKYRLLKLPLVGRIITALESHPVTNYMVHVMDKNPKRRMKKFRHKRVREPLDFECSLFMASLRKRPCLRVYYLCPWFYPHCVSLLQLWQQFTDVLLFVLAVGVWSPCILAMEICRAMVCCCLCTG